MRPLYLDDLVEIFPTEKREKSTDVGLYYRDVQSNSSDCANNARYNVMHFPRNGVNVDSYAGAIIYVNVAFLHSASVFPLQLYISL